MKTEKGFSLIEVIIAIGILGIIAAAIVTYFTWSFGVFNYTNVKATEESIARSQMEYIKSQPWNGTGTYLLISNIPANYSVSGNNTSQPTLFGENVTGQTGLQLITVIATRTYSESPGNQQTTSVTLQGYKGDR